MESELFPIGNRGYFAVVSEYKNYLKIHVRKWKANQVNPDEWNTLLENVEDLNNVLEQMQEALSQAM